MSGRDRVKQRQIRVYGRLTNRWSGQRVIIYQQMTGTITGHDRAERVPKTRQINQLCSEGGITHGSMSGHRGYSERMVGETE